MERQTQQVMIATLLTLLFGLGIMGLACLGEQSPGGLNWHSEPILETNGSLG